MPRQSKIKYDPTLSIRENADLNGCTIDGIRYYIRTRGIDRRFDGRKIIIEDIKKYLLEHPDATPMQVAKNTHHGINTIKGYWDIVKGKEELQPSLPKDVLREKLEAERRRKHTEYLDKLSFDFLKEYFDKRKIEERKRLKEQAAENKRIAAINEVKSKIDALIEVEHRNTERLSQNESFLPKIDKKDLFSKSNQDNIKCSGKFAYFYMDTPLSNWWTSPPIPYDGHYFTSSEAVFMYLKAKGMGDNEYALKIVEADNDTILTEKERFSKVKKLGKKCKFDETTYLEKREEWMYTALSSKFEADETFRDTLMKEEYLNLTFVEASPWDAIWGIKSRATKKVLEEGESSWKGLNLLGKLLTRLRDENLKSDTTPNHNTDNLIKSICGGVFGDISGSTREKSSKSIYTTDFDLFPPKSHPTDDSVLTIAIADWLLHRDTLSLTDALRGWGKKYPKAGFGSGFRNYIKTGVEYNSDKNGAAMRVSPVAIVAKSLDEALLLAKETAIPSHNSEEGIKGAQAIAASIFLVRDGVMKGKDTSTIKKEVKDYVEQQFGYDLSQSVDSIRERSKRFAEMKKTFRKTGIPNPEFRQMSDAAVSVPMAIIAFLEGNSYEEVLRIAISLGGDADTIGCMASSISVHLYGIPQHLYEEGCKLIPNDMKDIIDEFDAKYLSNN